MLFCIFHHRLKYAGDEKLFSTANRNIAAIFSPIMAVEELVSSILGIGLFLHQWLQVKDNG